MTLNEYVKQNMLEVIEKREALFDGNPSIFSYDAIDYNEAGEAVKVVYDSEGRIVELDDILHMDVTDFRKKYKFQSAYKALQAYLSAYKILVAEELIMSFRNEILKTKEKLNRFKNIDALELLGVGL